MHNVDSPSPPDQIDRRHFLISEVVERLPAERPAHDTVATIADWLAGPVLGNESGVRAIDEFAWR